MYQAITTKWHGPTDRLGARISATTASGYRIYRQYDCDKGVTSHVEAAAALAKELDWSGTWHSGTTGEGYVFVNTSEAGFGFAV